MKTRVYYGYAILVVAVVAKSVKGFGQANIIGYTIPSMARENQISTSLNSILFGVATWTGAILQIPLGRLVDQFGSRRCRVSMAWPAERQAPVRCAHGSRRHAYRCASLGLLFLAAAMWLYSACTEAYQVRPSKAKAPHS